MRCGAQTLRQGVAMVHEAVSINFSLGHDFLDAHCQASFPSSWSADYFIFLASILGFACMAGFMIVLSYLDKNN
jgi:hypothetical protein